MRLPDGYTLMDWNQEFLHASGPVKAHEWEKIAALRDRGLSPSEALERFRSAALDELVQETEALGLYEEPMP